MNFIEAIKMVYEKDAVIKRESKDYCIYKNKRTNCLRKLSFNKLVTPIYATLVPFYENYSLLQTTDSFTDDWIITNEYNDLIVKDHFLVHVKFSTLKIKKRGNKCR